MSDTAVQLRLETIFGVFRVSQKKRTLFRNDKPVLQWPDRGKPFFTLTHTISPGKEDAARKRKEEYYGDLTVWQRNKDDWEQWEVRVIDVPSLRSPSEYNDEVSQVNDWFSALEFAGVFYRKIK